MNPLFQGLLPALVSPFDDQGRLDEASLERVVAHVAPNDGVTALVVNGHAGEVTSLTREERRQVVERVVSLAPDGVSVISGIATETPEEGVEHALDAQAAGAAGLLVLPPHVWLIGADDGAPQAFFEALDRAVAIPLICFQYPARWGGARYDAETLLDITDLEHVGAVKDASWETSAYEEDYHLLKRERPDVAVLCANDEHLLSSFVVGADGALVGFGSVASPLIGPMLQATWTGELERAQQANERLYPLTKAFYKTRPTARMHSRIKHALHLQGVLDSDAVRQPLLPLPADERDRIKQAMVASGLLQ